MMSDLTYLDSNPGALALTKPPMFFEGVVMRVFPLRVELSRLARYCDNVLNVFSEHRFRPSIPIAFLELINYGKMSPNAMAAGWVAQNELVIAIPLEHYRRCGTRWQFQGWVSWAPFVFVDSNVSILTGREIIGWPKVSGWFEPKISSWALHPRSDLQLVSFKTRVMPKLYAGQRIEPRAVLDIQREAPLSWTEFPPSLDKTWTAPYRSFRRLSLDSFWISLDLLWRQFGLRSDPLDTGKRGRRRTHLSGEISKTWRWFDLMLKGTPTVNLKQFRDCGDPQRACFQALTCSTIRARNFDGYGMLGDTRLALGDLTGGYRVKLHQYEAYPIAERLGLVSSSYEEAGGVSIAVLDPILPFWVSLDMEYKDGGDLVSRPDVASRILGQELGETVSKSKDLPPYVDTRDGALTSHVGSVLFADASVFVYPLLADSKKLMKLCRQYSVAEGLDIGLGASPTMDEAAAQHYVYMVVIIYSLASSKDNDIGSWAEQEVTFHLPVTVKHPGGQMRGSFVTFSFQDGDTAVVTSRELYGWPTTFASFECPPDSTMARSGPGQDRGVLTMKTDVSTALSTARGLEERVLLEVLHLAEREEECLDDRQRGMKDDRQRGMKEDNESSGETWRQHEIDDLALKSLTLLELAADCGPRDQLLEDSNPASGTHQEVEGVTSLLSWIQQFVQGEERLNVFALKQFRDMAETSKVSYRALARGQIQIIKSSTVQKIKEPVEIRIHQYPTHPIIDRLGLLQCDVEVGPPEKPGRAWEGAAVAVLKPVCPFHVQVDFVVHPKANYTSVAAMSEEEEQQSKKGKTKLHYAASPQMTLELALADLSAEPSLGNNLLSSTSVWSKFHLRERARRLIWEGSGPVFSAGPAGAYPESSRHQLERAILANHRRRRSLEGRIRQNIEEPAQQLVEEARFRDEAALVRNLTNSNHYDSDVSLALYLSLEILEAADRLIEIGDQRPAGKWFLPSMKWAALEHLSTLAKTRFNGRKLRKLTNDPQSLRRFRQEFVKPAWNRVDKELIRGLRDAAKEVSGLVERLASSRCSR